MDPQRKPARLAKFLGYVLGRRPDEFALVPDGDGFVKIKELLKVCGEEPGWRHVRRGHIMELQLVLAPCPFEMDDDRIRALDRSPLPVPAPVDRPPRLLYACVRRRAHATVLEKGLLPHGAAGAVVLAGTRELALRRGQRQDQKPVLLTIHTTTCPEWSANLERFGRHLYTGPAVPPECITGPPLSRARIEPVLSRPAPVPSQPKAPGSFELDPDREKASKKKGRKRQKRRRPPWRT